LLEGAHGADGQWSTSSDRFGMASS
jgi:hypothetical protein